jgi:Peptidase family M23
VRAWPWLVGGLAAYAWARQRVRTTSSSPTSGASSTTSAATPATTWPSSLPGDWVWPVPSWNGRAPVISDGFHVRPNGVHHNGIDLMYARVASDSLAAGTPNGSKRFVMPDGTHALAASDGVVTFAATTPRGLAIVLDHGGGTLGTFYTHLEQVFVEVGDHVRAGQAIGAIGADPQDAEHLKHLHFEIWRGALKTANAIDPEPIMHSWPVVPDASLLVARNGLAYRPVGASGEAYPSWVRALKNKAGVYIIRDRATRQVVYVGSSSGTLYETLTRHFAQWRRYKGFWRGQFGEGHDPGLTYPRHAVEVAIRLTSPSRSLDEEMKTITRLKPRDNLIGQLEPAADEVPF